MEHISSWDSNSGSHTEVIPCLLWNLKVCSRIHGNYMASHKTDKWNSVQVTPISRLIFENNTFWTSFWAVWKILAGKSAAFSMGILSSESGVYLSIKTLNFHSVHTRASSCQHNFNYRPSSMLLTNTEFIINTTCLNIKISIFFPNTVFMFHIFLTINSSNQLVFLMEMQCQPYYFWVCDNV